jgi:hypothetical protein
MKQRFAAVGFALLLTTCHVGYGQSDHAPTVETCTADARLWINQITEYMNAEADYINKGLPNRSTLMGLTYIQLIDRADEMGQCAYVDPQSEDKYHRLMEDYGDARNDRLRFFIKRHGLLKQMMAEDAAGKRH